MPTLNTPGMSEKLVRFMVHKNISCELICMKKEEGKMRTKDTPVSVLGIGPLHKYTDSCLSPVNRETQDTAAPH